MSTAGGRETEIKLRAGSPGETRAMLEGAGFAITRDRVFELNVVFDMDEQLRRRRCLLRVREAGEKATLTFKGAPEDGRHKSREELEVDLSDGATARRIFEHLGFTEAFRYEKYRTEFGKNGDTGTVTLDETPIGIFLELEGSPEWIDKTAAQLGYRDTDYITKSYLGLYQEYSHSHAESPRDMLFKALS